MKYKSLPVKIPVKDIDIGIQQCLYSSNRLNGIASLLLEQNPRFYHNQYSAVLYYYALEEFGKALYLRRLKEEEKNNSHVMVYLYEHDIKINEAKNYCKGSDRTITVPLDKILKDKE